MSRLCHHSEELLLPRDCPDAFSSTAIVPGLLGWVTSGAGGGLRSVSPKVQKTFPNHQEADGYLRRTGFPWRFPIIPGFDSRCCLLSSRTRVLTKTGGLNLQLLETLVSMETKASDYILRLLQAFSVYNGIQKS